MFGEAVRDANHAADKNGEKKKVAAPPVIEKQTIVMDLKDLSFALDSTALSVFRKTLAIDEVQLLLLQVLDTCIILMFYRHTIQNVCNTCL